MQQKLAKHTRLSFLESKNKSSRFAASHIDTKFWKGSFPRIELRIEHLLTKGRVALPNLIEEEDWDRESKGRVALPNRMSFRKGSKRQLTPTPTTQNGPYLWKSCANYV